MTDQQQIIFDHFRPPPYVNAAEWDASLKRDLEEQGCDWLNWFTDRWGNAAGDAVEQLAKRAARLEPIVSALSDATVQYGDDKESDPIAGDPSAVEFPTEDGAIWWGSEELAKALHNLRAAKEARP